MPNNLVVTNINESISSPHFWAQFLPSEHFESSALNASLGQLCEVE